MLYVQFKSVHSDYELNLNSVLRFILQDLEYLYPILSTVLLVSVFGASQST